MESERAKLIDTEKSLGLPEVGVEEWGKWVMVVKRDKFPVIKSIRDEGVTYSMI